MYMRDVLARTMGTLMTEEASERHAPLKIVRQRRYSEKANAHSHTMAR